MDASTAVALIAALLAAIVAVIVPWATFRLALRQDNDRWTRKQGSELHELPACGRPGHGSPITAHQVYLFRVPQLADTGGLDAGRVLALGAHRPPGAGREGEVQAHAGLDAGLLIGGQDVVVGAAGRGPAPGWL